MKLKDVLKKHAFVFNCDKERATERIISGAKKPELFQENTIYGNQTKNGKIKLWHGAEYLRNSFRPSFVASLKEAGGRTVLEGTWRFHPVVVILTVLWFAIILYGMFGVLLNGSKDLLSLAALGGMMILGVAFCVFCISLEKKRMECLLEYIENCRVSFE